MGRQMVNAFAVPMLETVHGVGFRLGANVGYLAYSRRRRINPF